MIEGDSISADVIEQVHAKAAGRQLALVSLNSNHTPPCALELSNSQVGRVCTGLKMALSS